MAEEIKEPSQAALPATTLTAVYTVPAGRRAVVSSIVVANRTAAQVTYRLAIAPGGAADAIAHYLAYDVALPPNSSDAWTVGATLGPGSVVRAFASATGLSVNVFKSEIT